MNRPSIKIVPFTRTLKHGDSGRDVTAVQRALREAGVHLVHAHVREYDSSTEAGVKTFQAHHGLNSDGVYGPLTHKMLAPHFDNYGAWLMGLHESSGLSPNEAKRSAIVAAMTLLLNNRAAVHYLQRRPMMSVLDKIRPPHFPTRLDCSEAATWAYFVSGAEDPNGLGYNGSGYTGTLARHGEVVRVEAARPGDLVLYGPAPGYEHVAVYVGHKLVISQGSEPGPYLIPWNYRSDVAFVRSYLP